MLRQHLGKVTALDLRRPLYLEDSCGLAVDFRDVAIARNREHAIAHASNEAAEKTIGLPARIVAPCRIGGRFAALTPLGWHHGAFGEGQRSENRDLHWSISVPQRA